MVRSISTVLERWRVGAGRRALTPADEPATVDGPQREDHPLFAGLSSSVARRVIERLEHRRFAAGTTVLTQGVASNELHLVRAGTAELVLTDRRGFEHRVGHVRAGDTLGELGVLGGQPSAVSVRATTDLEVLVLHASDFHQASTVFPQIARNLGLILAERLAHSHHAVAPTHPRLPILLVDDGAPPLLGYALACSLAWHTRKPALLLLVGDDWSAEAHALAAQTTGADMPRAQVRILPAGGSVRTHTDWIDGHVLVQVRGKSAHEWSGVRRVCLAGSDARSSDCSLTLKAWSDTSRHRPDAAGVLGIPRPAAADEVALATGRLPAETAFGRAVGWAARDLAGLKVGLALGAGCEKGYAHLGVLRAFARLGLDADYVAGTSIGAAVGALYSAGYSPDAASEIMDSVGASAFRPTLPFRSVLSGRGLADAVRRLAGERRIEDLDRPFAVVATDLLTRRGVVFREGLIWPALLGSMAIPGIFPPQQLSPYLLVDGSLVDPVPSRVVREMGADVVIGVHLPGETPSTSGDQARVPVLPRVLAYALATMQDRLTADASAAATVVIEPVLGGGGGWGLRRFREGRRFIEPGERAVEAATAQITAALPWLRP